MADNVAITAGTGTTIATDQVGTEHFQKVKIADGTADSSDMVATDVGTSANALRVAPADDIPAGTFIGGVEGDAAHSAVDAGNPVKVGGRAVNVDGTEPGTPVAEADRADFVSDLYGRQLVDESHPNLWRANAAYGSAQTNTELKAAPAAGYSLYVTDIVISNGAAAGNVKLVEDTGGTPADLIGPIYLAINGLVSIHLKNPIKLTAEKNLGVTSVTSTTHVVFVSGYTAP